MRTSSSSPTVDCALRRDMLLRDRHSIVDSVLRDPDRDTPPDGHVDVVRPDRDDMVGHRKMRMMPESSSGSGGGGGRRCAQAAVLAWRSNWDGSCA